MNAIQHINFEEIISFFPNDNLVYFISCWSILHRRIGGGVHSHSEEDDIMAGIGCDERLCAVHIFR